MTIFHYTTLTCVGLKALYKYKCYDISMMQIYDLSSLQHCKVGERNEVKIWIISQFVNLLYIVPTVLDVSNGTIDVVACLVVDKPWKFYRCSRCGTVATVKQPKHNTIQPSLEANKIHWSFGEKTKLSLTVKVYQKQRWWNFCFILQTN